MDNFTCITADSARLAQLAADNYRDASDYTPGIWATETASVAALDALIDTTVFKVYTEVRGQYIQSRLGQDHATPRIDRLLMPTTYALEAGWRYGIVGVECKRSGEKIGRPISQMIDYSRALWDIDGTGRYVALSYVFLWPLGPVGGPIASVMAQQRLGGISADWKDRLHFVTGAATMAVVGRGSPIDIRTVNTGTKVGSR